MFTFDPAIPDPALPIDIPAIPVPEGTGGNHQPPAQRRET
jgi:hypothetical protein